MADKVQKEGCCKIDQIFGDDLNAKIGVLTRREVEARILAPIIIDTLSRQPGNAKVVEGAAYCDFRYTLKKDAEMCKLMIKSIFLILLILGCASMEVGERMSQFDETSRAYIRAIRWGEFEAAFAFKKLTARDETLPDFEDYRNVRVTNYKIKQTIISEDQLKIIQIVDFQYYRMKDVTVKTLIDRQRWEYDQEQEKWFLQSNLPAF